MPWNKGSCENILQKAILPNIASMLISLCLLKGGVWLSTTETYRNSTICFPFVKMLI